VQCGLAALAGFAVVIWVDAPGLLSTDSLWQLEQAQRHQFSDAHPPAMAWVWSRLLGARPSPIGMLILQNALFWSASALLGMEFGPRKLPSLGVLGLGFFPPVFALLGVVWKDVQMASALLFALALVLLVSRGRLSRWALAPVLLLLGYAAAVRFNGLLAVAPIVWLWVGALVTLTGRWRSALTVALSLVLAALAWTIDRGLAVGEEHLSQQYEVHDLVALSLDAKRSLFPDLYWGGRNPLTLEEMAAGYEPLEPSSSFHYPPNTPHFDLISNLRGAPPSERLAALSTAWIAMLARYPRNVLRHRWFSLTHMFGMRPRHVCYDYATEMESNDLGVGLKHPSVHDAALKVLAIFRHGLLYRGWLYLGLLAGATAAAWRCHSGFFRDATLAIAASGLGSVLAYPLIGAGCDFRYLWWLMISALLCLLLANAGRGVVDDAIA
jgi:hypothetical protein